MIFENVGILCVKSGEQHLFLYVCACSVVSISLSPWTVAHQAPLSLWFSRREYWSGLLCLPPGHLPDPGSNSSCISALAAGFFTTSTTWGAGVYFCSATPPFIGGWDTTFMRGSNCRSRSPTSFHHFPGQRAQQCFPAFFLNSALGDRHMGFYALANRMWLAIMSIISRSSV